MNDQTSKKTMDTKINKAKAFIDDLIEVCKKHNLSLRYDPESWEVFLIRKYSEEDIEWLKNIDDRIYYAFQEISNPLCQELIDKDYQEWEKMIE